MSWRARSRFQSRSFLMQNACKLLWALGGLTAQLLSPSSRHGQLAKRARR